jgi:hypothetical protein
LLLHLPRNGWLISILRIDIRLFRGGARTVFAFNAGFGKNTITDFNTSRDVLQFNHALFVNYAAAMADTKQVEANTVITYDANDTVTLNGVTASHLTASNFKFN